MSSLKYKDTINNDIFKPLFYWYGSEVFITIEEYTNIKNTTIEQLNN